MMWWLLTISVILTEAFANESSFSSKIVNGRITSITSYPYQVSVRFLSVHICGGTILTENCVITAGHCTNELSAHLMSVAAGTSFYKALTTAQVINVKTIIQHEDFDDITVENDLSLLVLKTPLTFNKKVCPIKLVTAEPQQGQLGTITGWGNTREGGFSSSVLRAAVVPIVDRDMCGVLLEMELSQNMICAGYITGGYDTCQGDSGGPLAINNELAGITSWGFGCARPVAPGVYTNVAIYVNWINEKLSTITV